jgi:hypothetical protein
MTIKSNSLGDRLNNFKNKLPLPESNSEEPNSSAGNSLIESINKLFSSISLLVIVALKSFAFGYSLKLIFNTNWNFWGFLCIGFSITLLMNFIENLIYP